MDPVLDADFKQMVDDLWSRFSKKMLVDLPSRTASATPAKWAGADLPPKCYGYFWMTFGDLFYGNYLNRANLPGFSTLVNKCVDDAAKEMRRRAAADRGRSGSSEFTYEQFVASADTLKDKAVKAVARGGGGPRGYICG